MAAHSNPRRLLPLAIVLCLMVVVAFGGYMVAGNRAPQALNLAGTSTTSGPGTTVYACLASGRLTHVSMTSPKCPAKSVPVQWSVRSGPAVSANPQPSGTASSSPSPSSAQGTNSSPASASSSPASTAPASTGTCTTSAAQGHCAFPGYAQVTGNSDDPYVDQDMWAAVPGQTQALSANSPGDWKVVSSTPAGHGGSVTTFPDTGAPFGEAPLSRYSSITSTFTETMPHNSATSAWAAYDLWFNKWNDEVMIQHDFTGRYPCTYAAVAQFGGSNGVPRQTWGLCTFGSERIWTLAPDGTRAGGSATQGESSGSVDIKAMVQWLENPSAPDHIQANSTITNLSYGWEIASTGGQPETFQVSSYSLTAVR